MLRTLSIAIVSLYLFLSTVPATGDQIRLTNSDSHALNAWSWSDCGSPTDVIEIKSLAVSPDPPEAGKNLTVIASGQVNKSILEGSSADVTVKVGIVKLLQKKFDLCSEAKQANASVQCPVEPGIYNIRQTVALPKEIPPAKFLVQVRAYDQDESDMLCVDIHIDFRMTFSSVLFG